MRTKDEVISGVATWTVWWLAERRKKLVAQLSDTMSVNPFLMPLLFEFHGLESFSELSDLIVGGHLMTGHSTGFGKLIDEKILPNVFGTAKLDNNYRRNSGFSESFFDEIDHVVSRSDGSNELLSLKAGKWTIQLTMAVQLNHAFNEIVKAFPNRFSRIIVGVFYGSADGLTDKYKILRGVNNGKNHDVIDLTDHVSVYAGREFWSWLNDGEPLTQDWVLQGFLMGIEEHRRGEEMQPKKVHEYLQEYKESIHAKYAGYTSAGVGGINWPQLLSDING
ncbi:hypothetical protein [Rugamonas sp. DEMB1]|uniref:hypothetical protein n=1 Tax=Rugamonas sp. DEMB1 TaxID=3039386 RepID=UPI00244C6DC1|nr:hypothetical protein [Rugamonas sp. DEMB1]WGG50745.1 hypothetical protein QC826_30950 [Rugamonas sp. DEMB1]